MHNDSYDPCFYSFIYTAVILVFTWPLYIYLITQWHAHQNHFVIRNRWPKISLIVVLFVICIQILMAVESAFCLPIVLNPISMGLTNAIQGFVYYRAYLLYRHTMKTRLYLKVMTPVISTSQITDNLLRCKNAPRFILYTIIITSIFITICVYSDFTPPVYLVFVATLLFGIICLINIIRAKVKDSIGITKECIVQIVTSLTVIVSVSALSSLFPSFSYEINVGFCILSNTIIGFCALFIAYNIIRQARNEKETVPTVPSRVPSRSPSATSIDPAMKTASECTPDNVPSLALNPWVDQPLWVFLKDNAENTSLFIGYLCECFALENMLFLERAIILHHLIKKYQKIDTAHAAHRCTDSDDGAKYTQSCYTLQFTHLAQIYNDIEAMIEKGCEHNDVGDSVMYKRGIVEVMKLIYRQFCSADSDTEINVAFDVRDSLRAIFEDNTEDAILNQFSSYEDLLMVFHEAIQVIMNLCVCIYEFQFRSYLRKNDGFTV
eukprot:599743_1